MSSEPVPTSVPAPAPQLPLQPLQAWLARLGLSGKLLAAGALVGVLAVFLPLLSMSMELQVPGGNTLLKGKGVSLPAASASQSVMVIRDWRGAVCLAGYLGALALAWVLYQPNGLSQKALGWAGAGVGALLALLSLWLLVIALYGSTSMAGFGASFKISVGFGAILNLLAAAAVAAGGVLKAREEKLF